jgi:hypothetical protein
MKHKIIKDILIIGLLMILLLTSCRGPESDSSSPAKVVEAYLTALVNKDNSSLSTLSCSDWEANALMELDSLQAVEVRLDGLTCKDAGSSAEFSLVNCQGNIVATYNGEDQNIDLSTRNYQVVNQGNEFLVCGYQ